MYKYFRKYWDDYKTIIKTDRNIDMVQWSVTILLTYWKVWKAMKIFKGKNYFVLKGC